MHDQIDPIAYVDVIAQPDATGTLATVYDAVKGADGQGENLYLAMSQTPLAIKAADDHYKALLHNSDNPLDPWLSELIATYVAILCGCTYAAANHGENFRMYLNDDKMADTLLAALTSETWDKLDIDPRSKAALHYTRKLTTTPDQVDAEDLHSLRQVGFGDKGISYLVQLAASFAYWARIINGLGIRVGDTIGLSGVARPRQRHVKS